MQYDKKEVNNGKLVTTIVDNLCSRQQKSTRRKEEVEWAQKKPEKYQKICTFLFLILISWAAHCDVLLGVVKAVSPEWSLSIPVQRCKVLLQSSLHVCELWMKPFVVSQNKKTRYSERFMFTSRLWKSLIKEKIIRPLLSLGVTILDLL